MKLLINGRTREVTPAQTLEELLRYLGLDPVRVAVELNRGIVPRDRFAGTGLKDGDALEIVQFVGGG